MDITSELLGKIGGADVEVIPVSASWRSSDPCILYIGEVPPGKTHWVFVVGTMDAASTRTNYPDLWIGDTSSRFDGDGGVAAEVRAGYHVTMKSRFGLRDDVFTGHIYIVKG